MNIPVLVKSVVAYLSLDFFHNIIEIPKNTICPECHWVDWPLFRTHCVLSERKNTGMS